MTVIPFDYYPKLIGMTAFSELSRTERAAKYYDDSLKDPYFKHATHPSFHLLGVLLDQTANPWQTDDIEVTAETLADLKDDGVLNGSTTDPFGNV